MANEAAGLDLTSIKATGRHQIVVGVDGTEGGQLALEVALAEAAAHESQLTVVFAWQVPMVGVPGAFDRDELETQAKDYVSEAVRRASPPEQVTVNPVVAEGDPAASLISACAQLDADILVVGTQGPGGFAGLLLGSVVQKVVADAPCPVMIVKPPAN